MKPNELENRLIQFAVGVIDLSKEVKNTFASQHLMKQLIRSSTSVALNYGEARSGESTKDFLHKMKICLKELRESIVNMKIFKGAYLSNNKASLEILISENNGLISIFVASIKTASSKIKR